jgi:hypothetical protein
LRRVKAIIRVRFSLGAPEDMLTSHARRLRVFDSVNRISQMKAAIGRRRKAHSASGLNLAACVRLVALSTRSISVM